MKVQNSNITFNAGLNSAIKSEIASCDVKKVSDYMTKRGISNAFKDNKTIAWCSLKCLEIIRTLNHKYNLKLELPNGVFVENFRKLNIPNNTSMGLTNFAPTFIYKDKDIIVPEKTIFFNEFEELNHSKGNKFWDDIDKIADENFAEKFSATDHFLDVFLHEFMHVVHEGNLIKKLGADNFIKVLQETLNPFYLEDFNKNYTKVFKNICNYATENPFEAVACDITKRAVKSLNEKSLLPNRNFIKNSPYQKQTFLDKYLIFKPQRKQDKLLKSFWNGNF